MAEQLTHAHTESRKLALMSYTEKEGTGARDTQRVRSEEGNRQRSSVKQHGLATREGGKEKRRDRKSEGKEASRIVGQKVNSEASADVKTKDYMLPKIWVHK